MHEYVDAKSYNTSFCDLVPFMMSNILNEVIVIIDENINDTFVTVLSPRKSRAVKLRGTGLGIFLLKTLDHYDACIPRHSLDLKGNIPVLTGHYSNSLDPRSHELCNENGPVTSCCINLAINSNKIITMSSSETNILAEVTGGLSDNPVCSQHDDDVTNEIAMHASDDKPYAALHESISTSDVVLNESISTSDAALNESISTSDALLNESISTSDAALDTISYLDILRTKHPRNMFIAHLNVNSIRYKFYEIHDNLNGNRIDIFGMSETKIDASFTDAQFCIEGFKLYRQDRDSKGKGGGIFVYIRDSIPHRISKTHSGITNAIEYMSFEVCFKRRKWFLVYMYKPPKVSDECAWGVLSQLADNFVDSSNLTIFFGDINYDMFKDNILRDICDV